MVRRLADALLPSGSVNGAEKMRRDHRPYFVKKAYLNLQALYTRRFLEPQMKTVGKRLQVIKPWHVEIFGAPVAVGDCTTIIAAPDGKVRLSVWPASPGKGTIKIGNFCLISPGVRIGSAEEVVIEDNCMIASRAYITDCDWHGLYDRLDIGQSKPVRLGPNVWVGDSAIVCKGVHIGENSIVGAGAVVVHDIPPNTVAAGNPARIVKHLEPSRSINTRSQWYHNPEELFGRIDRLDRSILGANSIGHWIGHLLSPKRE
jgi:acetyltransferase-like isoleucine patch superfamily enzyme